MPPSADSSYTTAPRRRLYAPRVVTRDIIAQLNEAEIADDPSRVRSLLSVLRNRRALPAKILIFHEDARPGYFGTWTRHSKAFGPTTHLNRARDPIAMEYDYDSGQEWEDEGNDNADDVHEGADDEDVASEADSDLDSWLVSDDEVEEIPAPSADSEVEALTTLNFPSKRKADDGERKIGKKRKVVVPLVPFVKGPCWETSVGQCSYEPFESYRIQLFNGMCSLKCFLVIINPVIPEQTPLILSIPSPLYRLVNTRSKLLKSPQLLQHSLFRHYQIVSLHQEISRPPSHWPPLVKFLKQSVHILLKLPRLHFRRHICQRS